MKLNENNVFFTEMLFKINKKTSLILLQLMGVLSILLIPSFLSYCFEAHQTSFLDLILLGLCGVCIIGKLILLYRRRQKQDKEELVERVE